MEDEKKLLNNRLMRIELALESINKKLDQIMGVNQPPPTKTDEEEAIRQRIWAGMEKRKQRALLKRLNPKK